MGVAAAREAAAVAAAVAVTRGAQSQTERLARFVDTVSGVPSGVSGANVEGGKSGTQPMSVNADMLVRAGVADAAGAKELIRAALTNVSVMVERVRTTTTVTTTMPITTFTHARVRESTEHSHKTSTLHATTEKLHNVGMCLSGSSETMQISLMITAVAPPPPSPAAAAAVKLPIMIMVMAFARLVAMLISGRLWASWV